MIDAVIKTLVGGPEHIQTLGIQAYHKLNVLGLTW
jgi:hypothetical protein